MSFRNDTITAAEIEQALAKKHVKDWCFPELRLSSGFEWDGRIDFLAINVAPSTGNRIEAYEIKVSRADFRRDGHKKQRGARLYSDKFWYIAPKGVIPPEEVPDWAGLIECEWHCFKYKGSVPFIRMKKTIPAPKRDKDAPSWGLVVSLLRNAHKSGEGKKFLDT